MVFACGAVVTRSDERAAKDDDAEVGAVAELRDDVAAMPEEADIDPAPATGAGASVPIKAAAGAAVAFRCPRRPTAAAEVLL